MGIKGRIKVGPVLIRIRSVVGIAYISFALAPSFGMFLINHFGFTLLFLVCTCLSLCSLFATVKLRERVIDPRDNQSTQDQPFLSRASLPAAIMVFMCSIILGTVFAFFPLYALNHGVANPGLFFSVFAVMIILGRALGGRILDLYSRESVILPCLITYIIAMSILPFSKTLPMFSLVAVILGIGQTFLYPALTAHALDLAGSSRGPAMGTFAAAEDLGLGLGPVIMGIVLRLTNYPIMFFCLALIGIINLNYFFVKKKSPFNYEYFHQ